MYILLFKCMRILDGNVWRNSYKFKVRKQSVYKL